MPDPTPTATGLEKFVKSVNDAFQNAMELQVLTLTGDVRGYLTQPDGQGIGVKWDELFKNATGTSQAALVLVAATQVKIDGDTILFISSAPEVTDSLRQAHVDATLAAQKYRTELVLGLANILGIKLTSG